MCSKLVSLVAGGLLLHSLPTTAKSLRDRQYWSYANCAYPGFAKQNSIDNNNASTYIDCSTFCFQNPQCKSFSFSSSGNCQLYDASVDNVLDLEYNSDNSFWDIACELIPECGDPGDTSRQEPFIYTNDGSQSDCINNCTSLSNCKSYAYGDGECFIYDVPVKGNLNGRKDSPYLFNDRLCIDANSTATITTSATPTVTTTSADTATITTTEPATATDTNADYNPTNDSATSTEVDTATDSTTTISTPASTVTEYFTTTIVISDQTYTCTAVDGGLQRK